jgi:hypothetical protein
MQHHSCDFAPVSTFRICVKQAQIRHEVLLVVGRQSRIGGCNIGDIGTKRWRLHGRSRNGLLIDQLCFGLLGILMTRTGEVRFALRDVGSSSQSGQKSADCVAKVVFRRRPKFCGSWARFSCTRFEGPHGLTQNSQATSITRLRSYESATARGLVFPRKILSPATFDFSNTICHKPTIVDIRLALQSGNHRRSPRS